MPRRNDYAATMDEQMEDLKDRMRLLQGDRKTNVAAMEYTKVANKDLIRKLREENKQLIRQFASLQQKSGPGNSRSAGATDDEEEISQLTTELNKYRKKYDDIIHKVQSQTSILEKLKDEVKDLEKESRSPSFEDSPQTRKIRTLENRLDKAMIKYNEAQSIRKTYEQIVKRLREERIGFDNQLAAIERTLAAKSHDHEELLILSSDANHAKEMVVQELERVRSKYEEDRRAREKEIRDKEQVVKVKMDMQLRLEKREKAKQESLAREAGDMNEDEEDTMKTSVAMNTLQQGKMAEERKEHRSKIDIFESAFRKIKEATGVSDVNEVIQKIFSQEGTTENLMMVTRENQSRIESLVEEKETLKARVEEMKYSSAGGGHRRKMVDDHEESLTMITAKLERARLKYERLSKILITVKAGVHHLADKVETSQPHSKHLHITDDSVVHVLHECEQKLASMLTVIKSRAETSERLNQLKMTPSQSTAALTGATESIDLNDAAVINSRPHNQRIPLPGEGTMNEEADDDGDAMYREEYDDALSREKVKKASSQILIAQDKKKKRPQKKKNDDNDSDFGETSQGGFRAAGSPKKR